MDKLLLPTRHASPARSRQDNTQTRELLQQLTQFKPTSVNMIFPKPLYCKLSEQRKASTKTVFKSREKINHKKNSCTDRSVSPHTFMLIGREDYSLSSLNVRKRRKSALTLLFHRKKIRPDAAYFQYEDPKHETHYLPSYQRKTQEDLIRKRFVARAPEVPSGEDLEEQLRHRSVSVLRVSPKADFMIQRRPVQRQVTVLPMLHPYTRVESFSKQCRLGPEKDEAEMQLGPW